MRNDLNRVLNRLIDCVLDRRSTGSLKWEIQSVPSPSKL